MGVIMPIAATYTLLQNSALSNQGFDWQNISQAYTDLRLVIAAKGSGYQGLRFNNSPSGIYTTHIAGNYGGTFGYSGDYTLGTEIIFTAFSGFNVTYTSLYTLDIFNYAGAGTSKNCLATFTSNRNEVAGNSSSDNEYASIAVNLGGALNRISTTSISFTGNALLYGILRN